MSDQKLMLKIDVDNGKYTVVQDASGKLTALRHGEPWRDCVGDNLICALAYELDEARVQWAKLLALCKQFQVLARDDGRITHDSMLADALNNIVKEIEQK